MKRHSMRFYNMILALGIFLITAGFIMFILSPGGSDSLVMTAWPIVGIVAGAVFLYFTLSFTHNSFHLFLGIFCLISGIFFGLVTGGVIPKTLHEWWPSSVIFASLALLAAGFYKARKLRIAYTFPAVTLFLFGIVFLLFSFRIIPGSFKSFVLTFIPFFIISSGIFMVALFLLQQKYNQFYIEEENEEIDVDEEEFFDKGL